MILRHNSRDRDNVSTTDKRPIPTVSVVWRFNCISIPPFNHFLPSLLPLPSLFPLSLIPHSSCSASLPPPSLPLSLPPPSLSHSLPPSPQMTLGGMVLGYVVSCLQVGSSHTESGRRLKLLGAVFSTAILLVWIHTTLYSVYKEKCMYVCVYMYVSSKDEEIYTVYLLCIAFF